MANNSKSYINYLVVYDRNRFKTSRVLLSLSKGLHSSMYRSAWVLNLCRNGGKPWHNVNLIHDVLEYSGVDSQSLLGT